MVRKSFWSVLGAVALMVVLALTLAGCSYTVNKSAVDRFSMLAKSDVSVTGTATVAGDLASSEGTITLDPTVTVNPGAPLDSTADASVITSGLAEAQRGYDAVMELEPTVKASDNFGSTTTTAAVLTPGVYTTESGGIALSDRLVLDSRNETNTAFVFICDNLDVADGASVETTNGATAGNVLWVVTGDANVAPSTFKGSIVASGAITVDDAVIDGRLVSLNDSIAVSSTTGATALTRSVLAATMPSFGATTPALPTTGVGPQNPPQNNNLLWVSVLAIIAVVLGLLGWRFYASKDRKQG